MTFVTEAIRALLVVPARVQALGLLAPDEMRRFVQPVMDLTPGHWDSETARLSRYGEAVAPPPYVLHATRRASRTPEALDVAEPPGTISMSALGLEACRCSRFRSSAGLNGRTEAGFLKLPGLGTVTNRLVDFSASRALLVKEDELVVG